MITQEFLVSSRSKVHNEISGALSQRLCDSQKVCIFVGKSHLFLVMACLDNSRLSQDDKLVLSEEYKVLLRQYTTEQDGLYNAKRQD